MNVDFHWNWLRAENCQVRLFVRGFMWINWNHFVGQPSQLTRFHNWRFVFFIVWPNVGYLSLLGDVSVHQCPGKLSARNALATHGRRSNHLRRLVCNSILILLSRNWDFRRHQNERALALELPKLSGIGLMPQIELYASDPSYTESNLTAHPAHWPYR